MGHEVTSVAAYFLLLRAIQSPSFNWLRE